MSAPKRRDQTANLQFEKVKLAEAARCCEMAGMRYVAAERAYVPWPDGGQR